MLTSPPTFTKAFASILGAVRTPLALGAIAFAAVLRFQYRESWWSIVGTVGAPLLGLTLALAYIAWRSLKVARRSHSDGA